MSAGNSLKIILGIPVRIKDNDNSGFCQVDAKTSSASSQQKHTKFIVLIESWNRYSSITAFDATS